MWATSGGTWGGLGAVGDGVGFGMTWREIYLLAEHKIETQVSN